MYNQSCSLLAIVTELVEGYICKRIEERKNRKKVMVTK